MKNMNAEARRSFWFLGMVCWSMMMPRYKVVINESTRLLLAEQFASVVRLSTLRPNHFSFVNSSIRKRCLPPLLGVRSLNNQQADKQMRRHGDPSLYSQSGVRPKHGSLAFMDCVERNLQQKQSIHPMLNRNARRHCLRRAHPRTLWAMEGFFCLARCRFARLMVAMQLVMGVLVICISMASLHRFYTTSRLLPGSLAAGEPASCARFYTDVGGYAGFDMRALADRVDDVLVQLAELQDKLEATALKVGKKTKKRHRPHQREEQENMTMPEFRRFLEDEVIHPLYSAHIALRLIRIPRPADPDAAGDGDAPAVDPLVNFFNSEETRKYVTAKGNRDGQASVYGTNRTYGSVGHACVLARAELDEYMSYDVGARCPDDWDLAQRLMLAGCDPLPRRRCLAPASKLFTRPRPVNESLWAVPDDGNVRWTRYHCRDYQCLSARNPRRGYARCVGCFDMDREQQRWMPVASNNATTSRVASLADFTVDDVLAVKPGEVRVGLDVSVGTGSFAARMRERGVTVVSTALNLGAPFAETIALRGLVPLYATMSQRLPLFDNTMDLVHTAGFFEGWVDLQLLDFVLFDWDRVLRPGGLLWVDKFACERKDLDDYMYMFLQFRYKKHRWVVSFKSKDEVYLSALLEKPPRS